MATAVTAAKVVTAAQADEQMAGSNGIRGSNGLSGNGGNDGADRYALKGSDSEKGGKGGIPGSASEARVVALPVD